MFDLVPGPLVIVGGQLRLYRAVHGGEELAVGALRTIVQRPSVAAGSAEIALDFLEAFLPRRSTGPATRYVAAWARPRIRPAWPAASSARSRRRPAFARVAGSVAFSGTSCSGSLGGASNSVLNCFSSSGSVCRRAWNSAIFASQSLALVSCSSVPCRGPRSWPSGPCPDRAIPQRAFNRSCTLAMSDRGWILCGLSAQLIRVAACTASNDAAT